MISKLFTISRNSDGICHHVNSNEKYNNKKKVIIVISNSKYIRAKLFMLYCTFLILEWTGRYHIVSAVPQF